MFKLKVNNWQDDPALFLAQETNQNKWQYFKEKENAKMC